MLFVVSKKRHQKVLDRLTSTIAEQEGNIVAKDTLLKSTEREQVLFDLQQALNLIRDYQRALSVASSADPKISQANALLSKYGIEGDPNAAYLGFQRNSNFHEPQESAISPVDLNAIVPVERPKSKWEREEEEWGDEAYGSGHVRIDAEAIDEGDSKESGYTRAHISFVDLND